MTGLELSPLGAPHLEVAAALHAACFPGDPWSAAALADIMRMPGAFGRIAADRAANPLGLVLAYAAGETAEIATLGVLPAVRRQGVGRALVAAAAALARAAGAERLILEAAADNEAALALYAGCGFVPIGRRPGYYRRSEGACDALALALALTSPSLEQTPARL